MHAFRFKGYLYYTIAKDAGLSTQTSSLLPNFCIRPNNSINIKFCICFIKGGHSKLQR